MHRHWIAICFVTVGVLIAITATFVRGDLDAYSWMTIGGLAVAQASVFPLLARVQIASPPLRGTPIDSETDFESWRQTQVEEIEQRQQLLDGRERDLVDRFARYQEFLEYPTDSSAEHSVAAPAKLSKQDEEVQRLLEAEAERVYEKIRSNGYTVDDKVDVEAIRDEAIDLIGRVARVYSPESQNPLLETSFEQLARSASRICLHSLVLLERMPLDVKGYNILQMYTYMRRAVQTYGAYQQVAPWLTYVSRGVYAGRLAMSTNPVTLGAWWLASEVGKRGAQHVVKNVVDRQAVTALHDLVTVIGVEAANIYGPGYRQRDPNWVYGTELTELLHRFPVSRESLLQALREITKSPMPNEYDRVYLYRCIAEHRSAGFRLADPSMISRAKREDIANRLETFFSKCIHGASEKQTRSWLDEVGARLDLRMKLTENNQAEEHYPYVEESLHSIYRFLLNVASVPRERTVEVLAQTALEQELPEADRKEYLSILKDDDRFEPPNIDPSAKAADLFLTDLVYAVIRADAVHDEIEDLVVEIFSYFRRSQDEATSLFGDARRQRLNERCCEDARISRMSDTQVKRVLQSLSEDMQIAGTYSGITYQFEEESTAQPDKVLVVVSSANSQTSELLLIGESSDTNPLWRGDQACKLSRRSGMLIDDCELIGGEWLVAQTPIPTSIVIAGTISSGRFDRAFAPILACLS